MTPDDERHLLHAVGQKGQRVFEKLNRRIDLVGDSGGEAADRLQPFARGHALFSSLVLGNVDPRADHANRVPLGIPQGDL